MILAGLTIRDYKQFAGEHQFEPERQGIMAVIGPNGAGKTTLFEAIEWCLYGPRSIANSDVFPRGTGGQPLVRIVLEDPASGRRIVVERRLSRSKIMQAEVWDEATPGEMLATGSAPVKKFVSEQLIGLGHAAFISTFFTRQKELSFFGAVGDTKRRRMVGQMIGLEAVRLAQESIGAERAQAANMADALGANAVQELDGRDFSAEITVAVAAVSEADALVARRSAESLQARQALEQINAEADRIRARSEQDQALGARLAELEASRGRLEARIEGLDAELARLDQEESRRKELEPIASLQAERAASVECWTHEQQRQSKVEDRRRAVHDLENERTNVVQTVQGLVTKSATQFSPEWTWRSEFEPNAEITRLLGINATLNVDGLRQELAQAQESRERELNLDKARKEMERFNEVLLSLRGKEQALQSSGDPKTTVERLRSEHDEQRSIASRCESERNQALERAAQLKPLLANLHQHTFGDFCPTCGRTITETESANVIQTLTEQIETWNTLAISRLNDVQAARSRTTLLESQIANAQKLADELLELRTRISNGNQRIAESPTRSSSSSARLTLDCSRLAPQSFE